MNFLNFIINIKLIIIKYIIHIKYIIKYINTEINVIAYLKRIIFSDMKT